MHMLFAILALFVFPLIGSAESSGKVQIYSKTTAKGDKVDKRDTFVLWSDALVLEQEEYDRVVVVGGDVQFYGQARDLVIVGGSVTLHDTAHVTGSLVILGGKFHKKEGAQISEQVLFELPENLPKWITVIAPVIAVMHSKGADFVYVLIRWVLVCLFGALLYMLAPELMHEAEKYAQKEPLGSAFWGLGGWLLFIPGLLLLIVSLIGIMFVPLFTCFYIFVFAFCSFIMMANIVGHNLPPKQSVVMPPLRFFTAYS